MLFLCLHTKDVHWFCGNNNAQNQCELSQPSLLNAFKCDTSLSPFLALGQEHRRARRKDNYRWTNEQGQFSSVMHSAKILALRIIFVGKLIARRSNPCWIPEPTGTWDRACDFSFMWQVHCSLSLCSHPAL